MGENLTHPREYSPLVLAYIGDAVYELFIRQQMLLNLHNTQVDKLHKKTISYVNAAAQCEAFHKIEGSLTEEERMVFKRGRNAKSAVPKNADLQQYRTATGVEALLGYIFLSGDNERLHQLMNLMIQ